MLILGTVRNEVQIGNQRRRNVKRESNLLTKTNNMNKAQQRQEEASKYAQQVVEATPDLQTLRAIVRLGLITLHKDIEKREAELAADKAKEAALIQQLDSI